MRWRSLGVLAVLLAIAAAAYYGLEMKGKRSDEAKKLIHAEEKKIDSIAIKKGNEQIILKREENGWRLSEPVQAKAEKSQVAYLVTTLQTNMEERTIDEQPKDLKEYGLDRPPIQLTITFKDGKSPFILLIGNKNPSGFSVYAKRSDRPAVILVADTVRSQLDRKAADFRDKTLLGLEPDKVKKLDLVRKGSTISLVSAGAEKWELTQPIKASADASAVRQLLWSIRDARIRDFISDDANDKRKYGLDHPDLAVTVTEGDASRRLLLKSAQDQKVGVYAMVEPGEGVTALDARLLTDLSKSAFDLQDRRLLRFETPDVRAIRLGLGGQTLALSKEKDAWMLTAPSKADADSGKVYELLYSLKELKFSERLDGRPGDLTRYGLKAPQAQVELSTVATTPLPALLIGKPEKGRLYAKLSTAPDIYAIDPTFLDRLPNGPDALKRETKPAGAK